jgi:hypothetical protein
VSTSTPVATRTATLTSQVQGVQATPVQARPAPAPTRISESLGVRSLPNAGTGGPVSDPSPLRWVGALGLMTAGATLLLSRRVFNRQR